MKLFLIASMILSGGGAVAMQNEEVRDEVNQLYNRARHVIQHRIKNRLIDEVKETGFPYPPQDYLDTLTEEQEALILTTIDQINATYDWPNMTDEEIIEALKVAKDELKAVYDELELDPPRVIDNIRKRIQERAKHLMLETVKEDGIPYPNEEILADLTTEQSAAITALIDAYNTTYDWATMTDEDIIAALQLFRDEMATLKDELGIETPLVQPRRHHWGGRHHEFPGTDLPDEPVDDTEGSDEV